VTGKPSNDNRSSKLRPSSRGTMIGVRLLFWIAAAVLVAQVLTTIIIMFG
jgi:hypothetical protein